MPHSRVLALSFSLSIFLSFSIYRSRTVIFWRYLLVARGTTYVHICTPSSTYLRWRRYSRHQSARRLPGTSANRVNDRGSRNNFAIFLERTPTSAPSIRISIDLCDFIGPIRVDTLHDNEFAYIVGSRLILLDPF